MKNIILIIVGLIVLSIVFLILIKKEKGLDKKDNSIPQQETNKEVLSGGGIYSINTNESEITWEGKKTIIKEWIDIGDIKIESGFVTLLNDKITESQIIVNMNSIVAQKTGKGDGQDMLSRHLKSADFFDVDNFPTANFSLTSITSSQADSPYEAQGELTIKGITKTISFPISAYLLNDALITESEIIIDRTDFDVRFGSANFFKDIGDNAIDNDFALKIKIVAYKQ